MWEKRPMAKRTSQGDKDERLGQLRVGSAFQKLAQCGLKLHMAQSAGRLASVSSQLKLK